MQVHSDYNARYCIPLVTDIVRQQNQISEGALNIIYLVLYLPQTQSADVVNLVVKVPSAAIGYHGESAPPIYRSKVSKRESTPALTNVVQSSRC